MIPRVEKTTALTFFTHCRTKLDSTTTSQAVVTALDLQAIELDAVSKDIVLEGYNKLTREEEQVLDKTLELMRANLPHNYEVVGTALSMSISKEKRHIRGVNSKTGTRNLIHALCGYIASKKQL